MQYGYGVYGSYPVVGGPNIAPNIGGTDYDSYILGPAAGLPVTLVEAKEWLKIDASDVSQDALLTLIIKAVSEYFERLTNVMLVLRFVSYLEDVFYQVYEFRVGKYSSFVAFKYTNSSGQLVDVPASSYEITEERLFFRVAFNSFADVPSDLTNARPYQRIIFDYNAGFGPDSTHIPSDLKMGLLNHIAAMYENRGDCDVCSCSRMLPAASKQIYSSYRMYSLGGQWRGG